MALGEPFSYRPRIVDAELTTLLGALGAVVIEGPRTSGKTETARHVAASETLLDTDEEAREAAAINPSLVLAGPTPHLIDEWQVEPRIWNHVRRTIDDRGVPGQFILTGSAVPADDITRHTGAGRIARLRMRPMSLFESGLSSGSISMAELLDATGDRAGRGEDANLDDIAGEMVRGGWPALRGLDLNKARVGVRAHLEEVCRVDVSRVDGKRRDPTRVRRLLRSLARNVATYSSTATLARDASGAESPLTADTAADYLDALRRLMVVEDQPAWAPHLRSKYSLRKQPKRHFVDPSLAAAALRVTPDGLLKDLKLLGFFFESLVVRDLRVYAQANDAEVVQYRDSNDHEVDAIVTSADGRWAAFEVKLGAARIDDGAESLRRFAKQIDMEASNPPSTLGVIVPSGYAYQREDGIAVIPLTALGP